MHEQYILIWRSYLLLLHSRTSLLDGSTQMLFLEPVAIVQMIELQQVAEHYWAARLKLERENKYVQKKQIIKELEG